jgi:hypothetical protein
MRFGALAVALSLGVVASAYSGAVAQQITFEQRGPATASSGENQNVPAPQKQDAGTNPYTFKPLINPYSMAQATTAPTAPMAAYDPGAPAAGCGAEANKGFIDRLRDSYVDHFNYDPNAPGTPQRAGLQDAPLSSPPYPSAVWNIGGTVPIGYDALYKGPLTDTLWCGPYGQWMKDNRLTVYGWLEPSMNISSSKNKFSNSSGVGGNTPAAYDYQPNTIQLDQAALYFEKTPDTVQKDHNDWGFRFTNLYGTDYKYTFSKGILSNQYIKDEKKYGYDPVMYYADFYFPGVADGMNVRVGRYISIPDIEAQLAPNNYTFTHSLLYTVDPYTQNGIVSTIKLDKNWTVQFEVSTGNDVAPWSQTYNQITPAVCVNWTSDSGNDNIYPCLNGINNQKYGYNNLQHIVATWYHKFNDRWHTDTEVWYMWQNDVPNINAADNGFQTKPFIQNANGAYCDSQTSASCTAREWAVVNYIAYQIDPFNSITFRSDVLDDMNGQRTGFRTLYYEFDLGWQHWVGDVFTIRPEVRWEHSNNYRAYGVDGGSFIDTNNPYKGGYKNQTQFAMDVIAHF